MVCQASKRCVGATKPVHSAHSLSSVDGVSNGKSRLSLRPSLREGVAVATTDSAGIHSNKVCVIMRHAAREFPLPLLPSINLGHFYIVMCGKREKSAAYALNGRR